MKMGGF